MACTYQRLPGMVHLLLATLTVLTPSGSAQYLKWWKLPDELSGRIDSQHHAPRCCFAADCLAQDRGERAFVTSLRSVDYLVLLRELQCSIKKHSPDVRIIVVSVAGDLDSSVVEEVRALAEYREVEEYSFPNEWFPRFSRNWMKLRVWNMTDLDAVIMLDSDMVLQGDLRHLFTLPTDFAWVTDAGPGAHETHSGGLIFLRPCRAIADDLIKVSQERPELRGPQQMAEQTFLAWYFRYVGMRLPSIYNTNFQIWYHSTGQLGAGGGRPLALHFSDRKLFETCPTDPEWKFLCHRPQILARTEGQVVSDAAGAGIACSNASNVGRSVHSRRQQRAGQRASREALRTAQLKLDIKSLQGHD